MQNDNEQCPKCNANVDARMEAQRMAADAYRNAAPLGSLCPPPHDGNVYGLAQMLRAPGKMFTRSEVLLILRAMLASKGGLSEAITAFESLE